MKLEDLMYCRWWTPPSMFGVSSGKKKKRSGQALDCSGLLFVEDKISTFQLEWSLDFISGGRRYHLEEIKCGSGGVAVSPTAIRVSQSDAWDRAIFSATDSVYLDECCLSLRIGGYLIDCWHLPLVTAHSKYSAY